VALVPARRHVDGRGELRIGAGEVEHRLVAADLQGEGEAAGIAVHRILVGIVAEEIVAIGDGAQDLTRLMLGVVEKRRHAFAEEADAELLQHRTNLALAGVHGADEGLEVAPVLLRPPDIGQHDAEEFVVELAFLVELRRGHADALLVDLG